jgi:hypothetical protein
MLALSFDPMTLRLHASASCLMAWVLLRGENPERIGDMLVKSKEMLASHYGKNITLLELTERAYREKYKIRDHQDMADCL